MNEEFSGGGQGVGARENKGWDHWKGFGRWERNGSHSCDGSSKRVESRRKRGKLPSNASKFAIKKWLNDGKNKW